MSPNGFVVAEVHQLNYYRLVQTLGYECWQQPVR